MNAASWIGIICGILVAVWANKKGYAWWAYVLASPIVGAIALGILPDLNDKTKEFENKEELIKKGNMAGVWISGLTIGFLMVAGTIK